MLPFLSWYGGKARLAPYIASLIPYDAVVTYGEPCVGAGAVLFAKEPSPVEAINDIDGDLVNLFRVVRDKGQELIESLELTPYSLEEFSICKRRIEAGEILDSVERARAYFTLIKQSFGNAKGGWNRDTKYPRAPRAWLGKIDNVLPLAIQRLRGVQIDNLDFVTFIQKYDGENTLLYIDPPYVTDATLGAESAYTADLSIERHKELVALLTQIKSMVILSGYNHAVYAPLLKHGFRQVKLAEIPNPINRRKSKRKERDNGRHLSTEFLWLNYNPPI